MDGMCTKCEPPYTTSKHQQVPMALTTTDKQPGVVVNKETPHWQEFPENRTQALKVTHKLYTT